MMCGRDEWREHVRAAHGCVECVEREESGRLERTCLIGTPGGQGRHRSGASGGLVWGLAGRLRGGAASAACVRGECVLYSASECPRGNASVQGEEDEESGGEWHPKDWDGVDAEEWPGGSQGLGDAG